MNDYGSSPFHRFQGWRILALFAVFAAYTLWYTGPGFFGQMSSMSGYSSLQETLIFDVPYMILQALVFEAFIAFGMRHIKPKNPKWNLLFILPIGFLLVDFLEDSFIALTLSTSSIFLGTIAGFMTALKFAVFIPAIVVSLIINA